MTEDSFLVSDLRRNASAAKRFQDERHKDFPKADWARWDANIPNQTWPFWSHQRMAIYGSKVGRPRVKLEERRVRRAYNQLMFADKYDDPLDEDSAVAGKHNARNDSSDALAVSSDTDVETDADADADITYSFDHATGPTNGDHILGDALTRAVERFETAQTEDLVRKEYEILDDKGEAVRNVRRHGRDSDIDATGRRQKRSRKRQSSVSNSSVDDGFEFV